jgi:hypothetical protein
MALDREFTKGEKPSLLSAESANEFRRHLLSIANMVVIGGKFIHTESNSVLTIDTPEGTGLVDVTNLGTGVGLLIEDSGVSEVEGKSLTGDDIIRIDGTNPGEVAITAQVLDTLQLVNVSGTWGWYRCRVAGVIDEPAVVPDGLFDVVLCGDEGPIHVAMPGVEISE